METEVKSKGTASNLDSNVKSDGKRNVPKKSKIPQTCTKAFDSLYYCYSPFHQARQYYINGELDDCRGRLRRFRLCLMSRLKPEAESELLFEEEEQREKKAKNLDNVQPVWELREEYLDNVAHAEEQEQDDLRTPREKSWWL